LEYVDTLTADEA